MGTKYLCDSNVFLALSVEAHRHHAAAVNWFETLEPAAQFYFCRATQKSFLRLLTVKEWMREDVCTNDEALQAYATLRAAPQIHFADEPRGIESQWFEYAKGKLSSPKRWMDSYLAAFARCAGMTLATFDHGAVSYESVKVVLLPLE